MTTPQPAALPELPDPSFTYERHFGGFSEPERIGAFTADQMRAYALATLQAQPAEVSDAEILRAAQLHMGVDAVAEVGTPSIIATVRAILALRPQSTGETFDQWLKREQPAGAVTDMERGWNACAASLRPQAVPMTDEQKRAAWVNAVEDDIKRGPMEWYYQGIEDAEAHYGITAQGAQGEQG